MDIVTKAMCMPKKIKLSDFVMEDGTNFGSSTESLLLVAMMAAVEKGSYVHSGLVNVPGFWDYVGKKQHLYTSIKVGRDIFETPAATIRDDDDYVNAFSLALGLASDGVYFNTEMAFMKMGDVDNVTISIKMTATPVG